MISDPIQIDIHLAIASELSKNPCIFRIAVPILAEDIEENFLGENTENKEDIRMKIYKDKDIDDIEKFKFVYFFLFNIKEMD